MTYQYEDKAPYRFITLEVKDANLMRDMVQLCAPLVAIKTELLPYGAGNQGACFEKTRGESFLRFNLCRKLAKSPFFQKKIRKKYENHYLLLLDALWTDEKELFFERFQTKGNQSIQGYLLTRAVDYAAIELTKGGNCDEFSTASLMTLLKEELHSRFQFIHKLSWDRGQHEYCVISDKPANDKVKIEDGILIDPWVVLPQVMLFKDSSWYESYDYGGDYRFSMLQQLVPFLDLSPKERAECVKEIKEKGLADDAYKKIKGYDVDFNYVCYCCGMPVTNLQYTSESAKHRKCICGNQWDKNGFITFPVKNEIPVATTTLNTVAKVPKKVPACGELKQTRQLNTALKVPKWWNRELVGQENYSHYYAVSRKKHSKPKGDDASPWLYRKYMPILVYHNPDVPEVSTPRKARAFWLGQMKKMESIHESLGEYSLREKLKRLFQKKHKFSDDLGTLFDDQKKLFLAESYNRVEKASEDLRRNCSGARLDSKARQKKTFLKSSIVQYDWKARKYFITRQNYDANRGRINEIVKENYDELARTYKKNKVGRQIVKDLEAQRDGYDKKGKKVAGIDDWIISPPLVVTDVWYEQGEEKNKALFKCKVLGAGKKVDCEWRIKIGTGTGKAPEVGSHRGEEYAYDLSPHGESDELTVTVKAHDKGRESHEVSRSYRPGMMLRPRELSIDPFVIKPIRSKPGFYWVSAPVDGAAKNCKYQWTLPDSTKRDTVKFVMQLEKDKEYLLRLEASDRVLGANRSAEVEYTIAYDEDEKTFVCDSSMPAPPPDFNDDDTGSDSTKDDTGSDKKPDEGGGPSGRKATAIPRKSERDLPMKGDYDLPSEPTEEPRRPLREEVIEIDDTEYYNEWREREDRRIAQERQQALLTLPRQSHCGVCEKAVGVPPGDFCPICMKRRMYICTRDL